MKSSFLLFLRDKKRKETQKKFHVWDNWEVAEAGWTLQFKTVRGRFRDQGWGDQKLVTVTKIFFIKTYYYLPI